MQDDFENNISQRMQGFSITPQPEIWQQVEAALPPEKKRRRVAIWWWLLPLVILLVGSVWLPVGKQLNRASKGNTGVPQTAVRTNKLPKNTQPERPGNTTVTNPSIARFQKDEKKKAQRQNTDSVIDMKRIPVTNGGQGPLQNFVSIARQKRLNGRVNLSTEQAKHLLTHLSIAQMKQRPVDLPSDLSSGKPATVAQTPAGNIPAATPAASFTKTVEDTIAASPVEKNVLKDSADASPNTTDTTVPVYTVASRKTVSGKSYHSTWIVEAGLGQSWQRQPTVTNSSRLSSYLQNTPSSLNGPTVNYASFVPPKASFSFNLGIVRKQAISPHWSWQLALRYQSLSTTQPYGSVRAASTNYSAADSARIYNTGDTLIYHNNVSQIQLVPRIEYTIHPASHFPVSIHTGFSIAYNISSNQLLHNYRTYNYLRSSALSSKWLYATEIGATIFLNKKVYVGLLYQYGLSNVAGPALLSDYRWRVWQAKLGVPLFNHSSK